MKIPDLYNVKPLTPIDKALFDVKQSAFDIENDKGNRTTIVGYYDGNKYWDFPTEQAFLDHLLTKKYKDHIIYAHNGSGFDFQRLLVPLATGDSSIRYKWFLNGGKLVVGSLWRGSGKKNKTSWTFSDSSRLYTGSLDKLAQTILGAGKVGTYDTSDYNKLREYNKLDCTLLYGLMDKLKDAANELGFQVKATAASCSFDYLRRQLPHTILLPASEYFYRSYFGGRVLLIKPEMKVSDGFSVDINSLYPWAMTQPLPTGKPTKFSPRQGRRTGKYAWDILNRTIGFVRARVKVCSRPVPPLPYLWDKTKSDHDYEWEWDQTNNPKRRNKRVIYPSGEFDGLWAIPDLLSLDPDLDYIYIRDVYAFEGGTWLKDMVDKLYNYRMKFKDQPHLSAAIKILLNSSYGKFGERREKTALVDPYSESNDIHVVETSKGVLLLNKLNEIKSPTGRSPAVAAYITAWSRYRWHQLFDRYQDKLMYLDTDSAYFEGTPDQYEFPITTELGDLKVEAKFDIFRGLASKVYGYHEPGKGWTVKAKGFPMGSSFDIHEATKTIVTGKDKALNYKEQGKDFIDKMANHYAIRASRPCTFATAKTYGVRPGDWATIERVFNSDPGTVRLWTKGMDRTLPPCLTRT